jgi:mRNA interferase MazF
VDDPGRLTQGAIHLARLDPAKGAEIGKLRPVVLLTVTRLMEPPPSLVMACPLSRHSYQGVSFLHVQLRPREQLKCSSYALVEHCRAIAMRRLCSPRIATVDPSELEQIMHRLDVLLGRPPRNP